MRFHVHLSVETGEKRADVSHQLTLYPQPPVSRSNQTVQLGLKYAWVLRNLSAVFFFQHGLLPIHPDLSLLPK